MTYSSNYANRATIFESGDVIAGDHVKSLYDEIGPSTPQTVSDTTDTLAAADARRLTLYSNASAVTVTVPTGTFAAGDWFLLQSTGAGGLSLSTAGITLNGSSPSTGVAQNEGLLIIFTGSDTISVFGGTA